MGKMFEQDLNSFGILKQEFEDPCQCLDDLGVTLTLKDGIISSKSYQKPTSLYQHVCPNSAHPLWVTKGVVLSMLKRYHLQNTFVKDFCEVVMLFYKRLRDRVRERNLLSAKEPCGSVVVYAVVPRPSAYVNIVKSS